VQSDDTREEHARHDARDTRAWRTIMLDADALASTMWPAHKEAQSEAKSLLCRTAGTSSGANGFHRLNVIGIWFPQLSKWRTQENHAHIPLFLPPPVFPPQERVLRFAYWWGHCATARDTRFLSWSSPCHFPSSALSSVLTPRRLRLFRLRHFPRRAGKQAMPLMPISWRYSSLSGNIISDLIE